MEHGGTAYDNSQQECAPSGIFHEKLISVSLGQQNSCCREHKFFSNPLRARKACIECLKKPSHSIDANKSINMFNLYAKYGNKILKFKHSVLGHLRQLSSVEVCMLKNSIDSKFNPAFREKKLSAPGQVKLQAEMNSFFDSIISSIVEPEFVLHVRKSWSLVSKNCGVYEIYAIFQYILWDIIEISKDLESRNLCSSQG
jgi:hypothetical protein